MHDLEVLRNWINELPNLRHTFARCDELRSGAARLTMEPPDELRNPNGAVTGQLLAALADIAGGVAAASQLAEGEYAATIDLSLHFMRAARDAPLVAESQVLRRGRSHCWLQIRIRDASGAECVSGIGTYAIYAAPDIPDPLTLARSVDRTAE